MPKKSFFSRQCVFLARVTVSSTRAGTVRWTASCGAGQDGRREDSACREETPEREKGHNVYVWLWLYGCSWGLLLPVHRIHTCLGPTF